jgi:hypothetical protein
MCALPALQVGQRVQVRWRCCAPDEQPAAVVAVAEDRHRVLHPVLTLPEVQEPMGQLIVEASDTVWNIGDVVPRTTAGPRAPRPQLDVVVYDLDADPMVTTEAVHLGLRNLLRELDRRGVPSVAMEPLGLAHRGITCWELAAALHAACTRGPAELEILLCEPSRPTLDLLRQALAAVADA